MLSFMHSLPIYSAFCMLSSSYLYALLCAFYLRMRINLLCFVHHYLLEHPFVSMFVAAVLPGGLLMVRLSRPPRPPYHAVRPKAALQLEHGYKKSEGLPKGRGS